MQTPGYQQWAKWVISVDPENLHSPPLAEGDFGVYGWTPLNSSGNAMRIQLLSEVFYSIDL